MTNKDDTLKAMAYNLAEKQRLIESLIEKNRMLEERIKELERGKGGKYENT